MRNEIEKKDYDNQFDPALLRSKNTVMVIESNMFTETTEIQKTKDPNLRKKIDHRRMSSHGS